MHLLSHFKRRRFLALGGIGSLGILGGGTAIKLADLHASQSTQMVTKQFLHDYDPYIDVGGFNQDFLSKAADVKQIWDFSSITQVQTHPKPHSFFTFISAQ